MNTELMGINEIATLALVSSQAVANWRNRFEDFPSPLADLASGPVFNGDQIRAWLERSNRKVDDQQPKGWYPTLKQRRGDDEELSNCIEELVTELGDKPGILLGKIQSGKTRGFVGVIAKAFDSGFDIALVLTKGTRTLSAQTVKRLSADFANFIAEDQLLIFDIMSPLGKLTQSELRRKIVIVAKKQTNNLKKLIELMSDTSGLQDRKVLLIDDEADLASVRFVRPKGESRFNQGTIANQIDQLRIIVKDIAVLQVTATPYSLYLQPENYEADGYVFKPKRPTFTKLLPIHSGYVGGDDYFGDFDPEDYRSKLFVEVSEQEQDALRKPDGGRIGEERILANQNVAGIKRAITTFIVAVGTRRWQQRQAGQRLQKYAMVIHNDTQRAAHSWQGTVIDWIFWAIVDAANTDPSGLRAMFDQAYDDLNISVQANGGKMPPRTDAFENFIEALHKDEVVVEKINSDGDVIGLLDDNAELRLRTPYNIWVGGNILDRGITIPNMISFYYGRNPKTMQADTVLQHSRMYGNRDRRDLAVSRLFTSQAVYDRLYTINAFENTLRTAFQSNAFDQGVVFIQADPTRRVRPCAPNKVMLSNIVTVSRDQLLLPSKFQTRTGRAMIAIQKKLDQLIRDEWRDSNKFHSIKRETAFRLIESLEASMEFPSGEFEWDAMRGLIDYYTDADRGGDGTILVLAETTRDLHREKSGGKSGRSILGTKLRSKVLDESRSKPALILLRQQGGSLRGWSAHQFWWPIFAAPTDAEPCVFATKVKP